MGKGDECCCVNGKKTHEKLIALLKELGCDTTSFTAPQKRKYSASEKQNNHSYKQSDRDRNELNLNGKENPCVGVLCSPKPYVNPPNLISKKPKMVTLDGRPVCEDEKPETEIVWSDYNPRNPPWMRPRYASVELRGGVHHLKCSCGRRDGLRDDCPRWDCGGRDECLGDPWPDCCPHTTAHDYGVRPPNRVPPTTNNSHQSYC